MATTYGTAGGRTMSVGSVLSRAFGVLAARPAIFFGLSFLIGALPLLLMTLAGTRPQAATTAVDLATIGQMWPMFAGGGLLWFLAYFALKALLIRGAVDEIDGEHVPLGTLAGIAARVLLPLFGLSILYYLAVSIGLVFLAVPGILLATIWAVAGPALVVERRGVFASFGRSAALTRGARWRVLGLVVVVYAIYFVAAAGLNVVGGVTAFGTGSRSVVSSFASAALTTVFTALWSAIQGALYVELRDWKDGPAGDRLADIFA